MRASATLTATLLALCLTGCGDTPPPRAAITVPDRARFAGCLALDPKAPALPDHEQVTLPDARKAYLADRAKERDTIAARFIVSLRDAFLMCQGAARYADTWAVEVAKATD